MSAPVATDRRRSQRFDLRLPVTVVRLRDEPVEFAGETKNLSSVGAYIWSNGWRPQAGESIEFRVTLRESSPEGPVRIYCKGRVSRIEAWTDQPRPGVAATIDRYRFERSGEPAR